MGGFGDGSCAACGKRYGWTGGPLNQPPCPRCSHEPDLSAARAAESEMEEFRKLLIAGDDLLDSDDPKEFEP